MTLQHYLQALKEGWWIALAAVLVCLGAGLAYSYSQINIYESQATFVANPTGLISDANDRLNSLDTLARRTGLINTYCHVLQSQTVFLRAAESLGVNERVADAYDVSCAVLPDSAVLQLRVRGPSPQLAADLTDGIGSAGLGYITELQDIFELRRLDMAEIPMTPIAPNHTLDLVLSFMIGVIGGVGILVLRLLLGRLPRAQGQPTKSVESASEAPSAL